jgi:two-component system, OmpR family, response regulator
MMAGKQPRILCLDDQPTNLHIRKMLLEQFGCEVVAVTNARDCLAAATSDSFDLALLDYHLGEGITGEDVAKDLRVCLPGMKLVMLTGDPKIPKSVSKSVDSVLTKGSSSPEDLLKTIQDLLPDCTLKPRHPLLTSLFPK